MFFSSLLLRQREHLFAHQREHRDLNSLRARPARVQPRRGLATLSVDVERAYRYSQWGPTVTYYGVASGSVNAIASDAQLVPAAEIHWLRPNGNPLSKYGWAGTERVFTNQAPLWY